MGWKFLISFSEQLGWLESFPWHTHIIIQVENYIEIENNNLSVKKNECIISTISCISIIVLYRYLS